MKQKHASEVQGAGQRRNWRRKGIVDQRKEKRWRVKKGCNGKKDYANPKLFRRKGKAKKREKSMHSRSLMRNVGHVEENMMGSPRARTRKKTQV